MPSGGPVAFGIGLLRGIASSQEHAFSRQREQLQEVLRFQKETRENNEAIAKQNLAMQKAQAEFALAKNELDLLQQRRAEIMASPGLPYRDARLEGDLEKARQEMADAHDNVQEHQGKLQNLIANRDVRIRGALPTKAKGWISSTDISGNTKESRDSPEYKAFHKTETPLGSSPYKEAIRAGEKADTPENQGFAESAEGEQGEIEKQQALEKRHKAEAAGYGKAIESGKAEQVGINEEKRRAEIFPLDKAAAEQRAKQLEAKSGMAAAAQEIAARQQQQQFLQSQMPRYGGGPAIGKGGGHGLLGALFGKSGGMAQPPTGMAQPPTGMAQPPTGMGGQAPQGQPAPSPGASGGVPTLGQAIGPVIGKLAQMPLPQAAGLLRNVLGGNRGGPAMAQQFAGMAQPPTGMMQPAQGGPVPATNSMYDPRTGAFTGQRGIDWQAQQAGQGGGQPSQQGQPLGGPVQQGNYRGQPYTYQGPPAVGSSSPFAQGAPQPPQRPQFEGGSPYAPPLSGAPVPPRRQLGAEQSPYGPRQPVQVPRPAVALQGQGGPHVGGSRSWRNNNPGNIEFGPYARSMGATGTDGQFAIFPSLEAGSRAQEHLLFESPGYRGRTIEQAISRWAPASENNVPAYVQAMGGSVSPSTRMGDIPATQRPALLEAMKTHEGWRPGTGGTQAPMSQSRPTPPIPQRQTQTPTPPPRLSAATPAPAQQLGAKSKPSLGGGQAPKPPPLETPPPQPPLQIDIKPFAAKPPLQQQQQAPTGSRASNLNQGVPTIHSPDQLKGMKPGQMFRAPDGSLRIVPLAPDAR